VARCSLLHVSRSHCCHPCSLGHCIAVAHRSQGQTLHRSPPGARKRRNIIPAPGPLDTSATLAPPHHWAGKAWAFPAPLPVSPAGTHDPNRSTQFQQPPNLSAGHRPGPERSGPDTPYTTSSNRTRGTPLTRGNAGAGRTECGTCSHQAGGASRRASRSAWAVRLAFLMGNSVTYGWAHDSIGLGEGGPILTRQDLPSLPRAVRARAAHPSALPWRFRYAGAAWRGGRTARAAAPAAGELGDGDRNDAVSAGEVVRAHVRARPVAGEDADDRSRHAGQDLAGHGIQPGGRRACGPPPTLSPRPRSSMSSSCCLDPRGCQSRTARLAPPPPGGCEGWS